MHFSNSAISSFLNRMRSILARLFCFPTRSTPKLSPSLSSTGTDPLNSNGIATRSRRGSDLQQKSPRKRFFSRMSSSNQSKGHGMSGDWKRVEVEVDGKRVSFERFDRKVLKSPNDSDRSYR